jgi:hypothetical protein
VKVSIDGQRQEDVLTVAVVLQLSSGLLGSGLLVHDAVEQLQLPLKVSPLRVLRVCAQDTHHNMLSPHKEKSLP